MGGRREVLHGWGRSTRARSRVYRPTSLVGVRRALTDARDRGLSVGHRGAGQSYGDAALNQGGALLVLTGLDRVLAFDREAGVVRAEAGVTIDQLWRTVISEGWWPPVVPGTSRPTVGGCAAANVHGKNHWQAGAFGDHVRAVTVCGPDGQVERVRRSRRPEELDRHLGALGLTGTILAVTVDLQRVHSGYLGVEARAAEDLREALRMLKRLSERRDYAVAWLDGFARGDQLGRGEVHGASHLPAGDPAAREGLSEGAQRPSAPVLAQVPRSVLRAGLGLALTDPAMRTVNAAKTYRGRLQGPTSYRQSHAAFHFLLDRLPGWQHAYGPDGLIQYQFFVPEGEAGDTFRRALTLQEEAGVHSYLAVMKRHRRQPQADTYSVRGYSLALDFPVREGRLRALTELVRTYDQLQERVGGRVYGVKDLVSTIGRLPADRQEAYGSNLSRRWVR